MREGGGARTFGGRDDVVAEEVGEDLAELDLEVRGARDGAGGGGGGGGDELAELVDVGEVAGHGGGSSSRRRGGGAPDLLAQQLLAAGRGVGGRGSSSLRRGGGAPDLLARHLLAAGRAVGGAVAPCDDTAGARRTSSRGSSSGLGRGTTEWRVAPDLARQEGGGEDKVRRGRRKKI